MGDHPIRSGAGVAMRQHPERRCRSARVRAFTLVEVLLAIVITNLLGLAVAMMLAATGSATQLQHDIRRGAVKRQVAVARLGAQIRCASKVLSIGLEDLILWQGDINGNSEPDLSELRRIAWNPDDGVVWTFESPVDLDPASDATFGLDDDFGAIAAAYGGSAAFPGRVVLRNVTAWSAELDDDEVMSASLVRLEITLEHESGVGEVTIIGALRGTGD